MINIIGFPANLDKIKFKTLNNKKMKIGRTKAKEIVEASKGKFITMKFTTKKNEVRVINGKYIETSPLGYLVVKETGGGIKNVNLQTISELKANKVLYKIN